jgi:gluconokinase
LTYTAEKGPISAKYTMASLETLSAPPPHLLFFMGLAGAGKTFTGRLIAEKLGYYSYDLDQDLIPEMRDAIATRTPFTNQMRGKYFDTVSKRISVLKSQHSNLIVMQAAYKEENRRRVSLDHPELTFVHVTAPEAMIVSRLRKRGDTISPDYALNMAQGFEYPHNAPELLNDTEDTLLLVQRFKDIWPLQAAPGHSKGKGQS